MSFDNSYVERLRKKARGVILPTQEICTILESSFDLSTPRTIADFGAGTLYFSEYFATMMTSSDISIGGGQKLKNSVCGLESKSGNEKQPQAIEHTLQKVDSSNTTNLSEPTANRAESTSKVPTPQCKVVAIDSIYTTLTPHTHYPNITLESSLDSALSRYAFDLFFASDVLHHLSQEFINNLLESIASIPIIVIKDIDSRHLLGHYANALHDLVFNQEKVCKVYPNKLESTLQALGYTTRYHYLPKLWYPHFLLLAYKSDQITQTTTKDANER
ncbi:hypothetical protein [Helicobacter sp.]|uniref:hypothetical protein n=1 Tax=Helicobacter sp. TaxID=218 RepID=UPI0025C37B8E|nr:hypothetical protein [Helicobacter sp.]MBR2494248.1 hypothetical protein [Helicobacter sp.]